MSDNKESDGTAPRGISRRTVAKASVWAVPVIAVATASPAYAASGGIITIGGTGCKMPGNATGVYKGYAFNMIASNTTNDPVTVTITSVVLAGTDLGDVTVVNIDGQCTTLGNPFTIPANTTFNSLALVTQNADNSQNGQLTVSYTTSSGSGTHEATATANSLPPITGGSCSAFTADQKSCLESI